MNKKSTGDPENYIEKFWEIYPPNMNNVLVIEQ